MKAILGMVAVLLLVTTVSALDSKSIREDINGNKLSTNYRIDGNGLMAQGSIDGNGFSIDWNSKGNNYGTTLMWNSDYSLNYYANARVIIDKKISFQEIRVYYNKYYDYGFVATGIGYFDW